MPEEDHRSERRIDPIDQRRKQVAESGEIKQPIKYMTGCIYQTLKEARYPVRRNKHTEEGWGRRWDIKRSRMPWINLPRATVYGINPSMRHRCTKYPERH